MQEHTKIVEEYLFDVFVKLGGFNKDNDKSQNEIDEWWDDVFLLEAITEYGNGEYTIAEFCDPTLFVRYASLSSSLLLLEKNKDDDNDIITRYCDSEIEKHLRQYLNDFYQDQTYYTYFIINGHYEQDPSDTLLQQQYLYVYTLENYEYFKNKIIYGNDIILK